MTNEPIFKTKDKKHNYGLVSFTEHFGHKWMTGDVYKEE